MEEGVFLRSWQWELLFCKESLSNGLFWKDLLVLDFEAIELSSPLGFGFVVILSARSFRLHFIPHDDSCGTV